MEPIADPSTSAPPTQKQRVTYIHDSDVGNYSYGYGHPMKPHRMRMTHNLVANYGLHRHMHLVRPKRATREQMTAFHTDEYIDFLSRVTPETVSELTGDGTRFLIGEDCPAFSGLFEFCTISAGGSIAAATSINDGTADVAINWAGGLHHAKKREASGFCYVNDIVLAILELLRTHQRVLYIDIDIHHGDGVEEAFYTTDRVMTVSFHKFGDFFPGTGDVRDTGLKKGKGYAVNVPLKDGVGEREFSGIFRPVLQRIMDWYKPGAVVLQCGADSLAGDKLGCFNLSMRGHADCVRFMKGFGVPLIVLGGGGYTIRNVARTWTYETGLLTGQELPEDLPFNEYMQYFGPEYKLDVPATSMDNQNSREYLEGLLQKVVENLRGLPGAPSVQMHETPRNSINPAELEIEDDEDSDLDERINQRLRDAHVQRGDDELSGDDEEEEASESEMEVDLPPPSRRSSMMRRDWSTNSVASSSVQGLRGADNDLAAMYGSGSAALNGGARHSPASAVASLGMGYGTRNAAHTHDARPKRSFFAARRKAAVNEAHVDTAAPTSATARPRMLGLGRSTAVLQDDASDAGGTETQVGSPMPSNAREFGGSGAMPAHLLAA